MHYRKRHLFIKKNGDLKIKHIPTADVRHYFTIQFFINLKYTLSVDYKNQQI